MKIRVFIALLALVLSAMAQQISEPRVRARDLGIQPGVLPTGKLNAITDVGGVKVGQVTLRIGDNVRTGVTAILPHDGNIFQRKVPAAVYAGNGFGKLVGSTQIDELGVIESPRLARSKTAPGRRMRLAGTKDGVWLILNGSWKSKMEIPDKCLLERILKELK